MKFSSFNRSSILSKIPRFFFGGILFLLLSSSALSQESLADPVFESSTSVEDLTVDQFQTLSALAPLVLGSSSSGNVTNDVAAILLWLQSIRLYPDNNSSSANMFFNIPMAVASGQISMWKALAYMMQEDDASPHRSGSYLMEIQRALYGRSGVPSSDTAVVPALQDIISLLWVSNTNSFSSSQDLSFLVQYAYLLASTVSSSASAVDGSSPTVSVHDALLAEDVRDILDVLQGLSLDLQSLETTVEDGFTSTNVPAGSPRPTDYDDEISSAETSARESESESETTLSNIATNNLPLWQYTQEIPGDLSPISSTQIDFSGADGMHLDEAGIPLIGEAIVASSSLGGITLPTKVLETSLLPGWRTYVVPWKNRFHSLFAAIWTLVTGFAVCFVVRREWLFYMGLSNGQSATATADATSLALSDNFFG